ncbi:ATP-dependent DNA ligase [Nakamurella sp.]|uniref:ATP-dependent DNA ligase n=1 Tax=Nakamurella sp. TaxID=1869182 RepID=UPI003B3AACC5
MAADGATVEVDGHRIALTHLRKVLYPATGTTKSDVITYLAEVAHVMIPHLADRPVTRKRWPDGVSTQPFFHKDLPKGTPTWVPRRTILHSDGPKNYPIVDSPATLVWLGQIAALELHVPQWTFPDVDPDTAPDDPAAQLSEAGFDTVRPNRLVFDLDPGPGVELADCAVVARAVRERMAGVALVPVTSGSKGIHLYSWLDGTLTSDDASAYAREIAEAIERDLPDLVVSRMAKSLRRGKVFIDWSQNNGSKTTIAPYSLRGREHPTVAAPRTWEELADPELMHLEYAEVLRLLERAPDPMAGLESGDNDGAETRGGRRPAARPDHALDTYRSMRSAARTPEPVPEPGLLPHGADDTFVIQEHHARRLHYDFRLERDGVLVSWAVPKGVPETSGRNHLAVHTEDHPMDYADFAGEIPTGEYGGGTVTIWDRGTYATEKWRADEVIVVLRGAKARGRYALIRTGGKNWLMHRMKDQSAAPKRYDDPRPDTDAPTSATRPAPPTDTRPAPPADIRPMLATAGTVADVADGTRWRFEGKWDGIRAIATVGPGGATLRSRLNNDVTHTYPELAVLADLLAGHGAVLDGEIVALQDGRTSFHQMQRRMNVQRSRDVARVMREVAVEFWVFDVLWLDGVGLLDKRYDDRRRLLDALPLAGEVVRVPDQLPGPAPEALQDSADRRWEGIVAKLGDSTYQPGRRSRSWIKIKNFRDLEVAVVGWTPGSGRRAGTVGALMLAVPDGAGGLRYAGKVGTGFTDAVLDQLMAALDPLRTDRSAVGDTVPRVDAAGAVWVRPELIGEVKYGEWTPERRLRATSWRGLRTDKTVADLVPEPDR